MEISKETLRVMIRSYKGFDLTDDEMDLVLPELQSYFEAVDKMNELDLSDTFSARLSRAREGNVSW